MSIIFLKSLYLFVCRILCISHVWWEIPR